MRLLASWLVGEHEGTVFYSGTGGAVLSPVPPDAVGFRLRRWPSEGLAPEYLDWKFEKAGQRVSPSACADNQQSLDRLTSVDDSLTG
jgi:hypothetical protein